MFQGKRRGFRRHSNGRGRGSHENRYMQARQRSNPFSNNQTRNNFRPTQSAERLLEKYSTLAKEAMSSGDRTLGENYLQHADHFMRVVEDKNKDQNKVDTIDKVMADNKPSSENNNIKQQDTIKNKE